MSRQAQQIARLVQSLLRNTRGRMPMKWTLALGLLLVGYLIAQPYLERAIGVSLPGLAGDGRAAPADEQAEQRQPSGQSPRHDAPQRRQSAESSSPPVASRVLQDVGGGVLESPAGLRYTRSRQDNHRLNHIMAHAQDRPNRPGQHGVFDSNDTTEVVLLIDQAYEQALTGKQTKTSHEDGRVVHDVNLGRRIGYVGGQSGNRRGKPAAKHIRLVLHDQNVITAFPVRP